MSTHWYYTRDGRMTFGPVTWQELRRMASTGELLPSDVVGHVGMRKSTRAGRVAQLFTPIEPSRLPADAIGTGVGVTAVLAGDVRPRER